MGSVHAFRDACTQNIGVLATKLSEPVSVLDRQGVLIRSVAVI